MRGPLGGTQIGDEVYSPCLRPSGWKLRVAQPRCDRFQRRSQSRRPAHCVKAERRRLLATGRPSETGQIAIDLGTARMT